MVISISSKPTDTVQTAQPASRRLRIAMVAARFRPLVGGTETHVYEVGRRLAARGHEVTVLTTDPGRGVPNREFVEGMRVLRAPTVLSNLDVYLAPKIARFVARGGWDVVHCQGYHTLVAPLTMLAAQRNDIPYVLTFHSGGHSSRLRVLTRPVQWRMLRPMLARAAHLVGVSEFEAQHFQEQLNIPASRFSVILNGADSVARMPRVAPGHKGVNGAGPLIVSPGRLERYKGHHRVIQALPLVVEEYPGVRLRIAGAGSYGHHLRKLANDLGIGHRVEIARVPVDDRDGMARLLARASLVTAMSDYEAYPIAVLEALSCGCKVLAADTSGLSAFGRYDPVRTIPPNSTPEFVAAAMVERLRAPEMSAELDLPTWASCSDQLEELYYQVVCDESCA